MSQKTNKNIDTSIDKRLIEDAIESVIKEVRQRPIPVGISNHHVHLCHDDFVKLFPGQDLTLKKKLLQPGQYAAEETVSLCSTKGCIEHVRVLGPLRSNTQVEISTTDARVLGLKVPLRLSGHLQNTPGIKLVSPFAEVTLDQGVIVALRHIHMSRFDALVYGVSDGDTVKVAIQGTQRKATFEDVAIRVSDDMTLEMHIDTDEANAADVSNGAAYATLLSE